MGNLNTKITRVMSGVAAGTTDQTSSIIDMNGYEGVRFIALFGALTATQVTSMKVQQGAAVAMGDAADLAGSSVGPLADADSNEILMTDILRPRERYVRVIIDRGTANAVIDGVIAEQYGARVEPPTQDATTVSASETHQSPAEGTA